MHAIELKLLEIKQKFELGQWWLTIFWLVAHQLQNNSFVENLSSLRALWRIEGFLNPNF